MFIVAAASAISACAGSTNGRALPVTPTTGEAMLAPKVVKPLTNTGRYEKDPCAAATMNEVAQLGGPVKGTSVYESTPGKTCQWTFDGGTGNIAGTFVTGNKDGLNSLYLQNRDGVLTTFKIVSPVEGYPAVAYSQGDEGEGNCAIAVGVRDDLTFTVITHLRDGNPELSNPCKMATALGAVVVDRLKTG
ncbi:DUF3558 domain-containing protein [Amycolatopsis rhabdoformis]|uniref:DUF3558 domain-containing protein n=1 Tax=Amycolatopsis rhabdoformis TaxID=1448059 RepID=A0ABZ1I385_9PSEU|nr:DUF3558 domain-containing protein [Amycolatopsis rhabdoformis]WSE28241.1 DUF3558 domain-containing protein [Amycolatopsis rhabdoformis]